MVGRFINSDEILFINGHHNVIGLNTYTYCINSPISCFDPAGQWVLSVGIEGQAAFALGVYAGFAVNIDGKQNVSELKGWGISVGAVISLGIHVSGGGSFDVGFDGSAGGNINAGFGFGASLAPVPYFQTRIGYTGTLYEFNLIALMKHWADGAKKALRVLSLNVVITKEKIM